MIGNVCKICSDTFVSAKSHRFHYWHKHKDIPFEDYVVKFFIVKQPSCKVCDGKVKWRSLSKGFDVYCSTKCAGICKEKRAKTIENTNFVQSAKTRAETISNIENYKENLSQTISESLQLKRAIDKTFDQKRTDTLRKKDHWSKMGIASNSTDSQAQRRETNVNTGRWIPDTQILDFEKYKRQVWKITRVQPIQLLENFDKPRGINGVEGAYQLDHITSIKSGYINGIDAEVIANIDNLRFIPWEENLKKGWMK